MITPTTENSSDTAGAEEWMSELAEAAPIKKKPKKAARAVAKKIVITEKQREVCVAVLQSLAIYNLVMSLNDVPSGFTSEYIRSVLQSKFIDKEINKPLNTVEEIFEQVAEITSKTETESKAPALKRLIADAVAIINELESENECYMHSEDPNGWGKFKDEIEEKILNNPSFPYNEEWKVELQKEKVTILLDSTIIQAQVTLKTLLESQGQAYTTLTRVTSNMRGFMGGKLLTPIRIKDYKKYQAYLMIICESVTDQEPHEKLCLKALGPVSYMMEHRYRPGSKEYEMLMEAKEKITVVLGYAGYQFSSQTQMTGQIV